MSNRIPGTHPTFKALWRRAKQDFENNLKPQSLRNLQRAASVLCGIWIRSSIAANESTLSLSDFVDDVTNLLDDMSAITQLMNEPREALFYQSLRLKSATGVDGPELEELEVTQTDFLFCMIVDIHSALYTILDAVAEEDFKKGNFKDALEEFGGALEMLERCTMINDNHLHVKAILLKRAVVLRHLNRVSDAEEDEAASARAEMVDPPTDYAYTNPEKIFFRPVHGGPPELYKYTPKPSNDTDAGSPLDRDSSINKNNDSNSPSMHPIKRKVTPEHAQMCYMILVTVEHHRRKIHSDQAMFQLLRDEEEQKNKNVTKLSKSQKRRQIKKKQAQERESKANMTFQQLVEEQKKLSSLSVDEFALFDDCICPISLDIMHDPVTTVDGHTFDRASIQDWFDRGKMTNPMTNEILSSKTLVSNETIKRVIQSGKFK